jgi:alpha/beta superfamily hydrolase
MKKLRLFAFAVMALATLHAYAISENVKITGDHGQLDAIIQTPKIHQGQRVPMVIICHGFMGNKNEPLLTNLADSLEKRGIASIRFDFNGHGQSEGRFQDMTVPNELIDAQKVYDYVAALPYVSKIEMAGHSQGGVVTAMTAGNMGVEKIKAICLMAPAAVLREDALRGNTFGAQYDPYNPPAEIKLFGGRSLGGNFVKTAITLPIYETAMKYTGKAIILHGNTDRIVPYTYGQRFHYVIKDSEFHLLNSCDHGFGGHVAEAAHLAADYLQQALKCCGRKDCKKKN